MVLCHKGVLRTNIQAPSEMANPSVQAILPQVDDRELVLDDSFDIESDVIDIAPRWKGFGKALHLSPNLLDKIEAKPGANPESCLADTLAEFLKKNYDWSKYGVPSWRMIVQAVGHKIGGGNPDLALRVADQHKLPAVPGSVAPAAPAGGVTTRSPPTTSVTHPILQEPPSMKLICRIRYMKNNKTKTLRLIDWVTTDWVDVARQLDFDEAKISTFRKSHPGEPKEAASAMLSSWTRSDVEATWAKLIGALEDASNDLAVQAKEFKHALLNQID